MKKENNEKKENRVTCRECAYSTGWHNRSVDGSQLILAACPLMEHEVLLNSRRVCRHFKQRLNIL